MISGSITLSLVQNTAILLSFIMLFDYFWAKEERTRMLYEKVMAGLIIGGIGVVLLYTPWESSPGIFFDARSVLLSISGLFFGLIPTVIAMVIVGLFKIYIAGDGLWMGLGIIFSSGLIGILWRTFRPTWQNKHHLWELLGLSIVVHVVMLGCTVFLPNEQILSTFKAIVIPIIFIYFPGTMILGHIMVNRVGNWLNKKELNETKALYASLVEHMPAGVFRKLKDGRYVYVNSRFCVLKGLTEKEILGKTTQELADYVGAKFASGELPEIMRQWALEPLGGGHHEQIMQHNKPMEIEEAYLQKDGSMEYFQVVKTPIFDLNRRIIGSQGMQFDITHHKLTEDALINEQYLLNSFMNNTPDLIYFKDLNSRFMRINRAHANSFGLGITKEAVGKTDFDFFTSEHAQKAFDDEQKIIKTGISMIEMEEKETWIDGRITWASTSKFPLIDKNGRTIGTFGASRDITLPKRLQEELIAAKEKAEENDHLKTAFLHNISHEIRTPMNAIIGFSGLLNDPDLSIENRAHFSSIIVQSGNQLLSIIDDIVRIATIDAGQEKINESEIQINSLCQLSYEQFTSKAEEKGIDFKFSVDLPDDEAIIFSDETKLLQVISNLLVNAFKFTTHGHIHFGYIKKDDQLEFFIEDTGIGIPEEFQEEIFTRFRQVESNLSRQFGGSGLGLSICKAYIELMGGKMWVTSNPGAGSVFYFTIKYLQASVKKQDNPYIQSVRESSEQQEKPLTLLVAEDEDFNFMLLRELLSLLNARIIRAVDGVEAVEIASVNEEIDLVLMDIKMPNMDGYEATKRIKALRPSLPIFAITAYSQDSDRDKAIDCGCSDFIVKPFNKDELITKIKVQLSNRES